MEFIGQKKIDNSQSKGCLENRFTWVYWTKQMDQNGPKRSSKIKWAQKAISRSNTKTVGPGPMDPHLFQSLLYGNFLGHAWKSQFQALGFQCRPTV